VRNFRLNGLSATSVEAAVGPKHSGSIRLNYESDGELHSVRTVTLDGLMADLGLQRVDLLLCDTQGGELEMLPGAVNAIRQARVRFMVISTHWFDDRPLVHQTCTGLVQQLGGHIIADHSIPESCSGDGLIVASFDARDREMTLDLPIVRARDSLVGELEWPLARRVGWRGVLRGVADLLPAAILTAVDTNRQRLASRHRSRAGAAPVPE
jgi:hypothetical protein